MERRAGALTFAVDGPGVELFLDEAGGHRWQRVPPTERRGRVHTSTVTVAVLPEPTAAELAIPARDLAVKTARGSGRGGQARNVTESAVTVRHLPTGLTARSDGSRSQYENRKAATDLVRARVWAQRQDRVRAGRADDRKRQVGSGMRGDKRRTIRHQDGVVHDHVDGRRWRLRDYLRGEW